MSFGEDGDSADDNGFDDGDADNDGFHVYRRL